MAPRIYFVLELDIDNSQLVQDDFSEEPYSAEERFYAAVYSPLSLILESPLHNERMVEATYVNIQDQCFKMNANTVLPHGETSFLAMMAIVAAGLYQNGRVFHPTTNQEMMSTIDNRGLLHFLPNNSRIIGCLCGTSSRSGTDQNIRLDNYLATVNDNRPVVFVVGDMVDPSVTQYVDDFVTVSEMDVTTATCLSHVMDEAERKWIN